MDAPGQDPANPPEAYVKAATLRGMLAVLERERSLDAVLARLSPAGAELLRAPPPSTTWVPIAALNEISVAIAQALGPDAPRRITHESVIRTTAPLLKSVLGGMIRIFGPSPHTILSRLPDILKLTTRGLVYTYTRLSERSARMRITYVGLRDVPHAAFAANAGALEAVFDLCEVRGRVASPAPVRDASANAADFELSWS